MPTYDTTGLGPTPKLLLPGEPSYLFGSFTYDQAPTRFTVTNVALTTNVATVTILIESGNIPVVGQTVSIRASTSTSGLFNVTNAVLTGVTITSTTGVGTITFALTHGNVASAPDTGYGIVPVAESAELLGTGDIYSAPVAVARNQGATNVERTINPRFSFPSAPDAVTGITIQGALVDKDSDYVDMGSSLGSVTGGVLTPTLTSYSLTNVNFIRAKLAGVSGGTNPSCVFKVL